MTERPIGRRSFAPSPSSQLRVTSSSVCMGSASKGSTQPRRNAQTCPQVPSACAMSSARVRTYVPFEQSTSSSIVSAGPRDRRELENLDLPRGARHREAGARQAIERLAVALQRRVHWRHLRRAEEAPQRVGQRLLPAFRHRRLLYDGALAISSGGSSAESDPEAIPLAAGKDLARDLGRLPQA